MARLHGFILVELEQTGSGAEDVSMAFPLVNGLSVLQYALAGGAGRRTVCLP